MDSAGDDKRERWGLAFGLLAVAGFSVTLPATRLAVAYLDPVIVGLGRALVAAVCAAMLLLLTRQRWPTRTQWLSLIVVALGVIIGFPWLSAVALQDLPAAHGAVVVALLPLLTGAQTGSGLAISQSANAERRVTARLVKHSFSGDHRTRS